MLRSIGKQSAESVELVLKKKKEVMVGSICRKAIKSCACLLEYLRQ